ncbi:MAG TPA: YueI family protein [Halanaerobiales bacterium]|nr:YueI family protein [Halanaerobiales bacterium]
MDKESRLEKKLKEGIYGKPELKKEERSYYLGEFKERVIRYLSYEQVEEPGTYPEILEAIRHLEARKLLIDRQVDLKAADDYIRLAHQNNLQFKRVDSPDFKGDIALVVVSDHAVDTKEKGVISRQERLKKEGISDKIIENVGAKLCADCWKELQEKAPAELLNYEKMGFLDSLMGIKCPCKK